MKKISNNDLSELQSFMGSIEHEISRYSHVSDFLPKSLTAAIKSYAEKLQIEKDRREDEY